MITHMRTALVIDNDLLRRAKLLANERNQAVSDVVNSALREYLGHPAGGGPPFSLITYGGASKRVRHEPSAALEQEEGSRLRR
jgi:hypothetical protein